MRVSTITTRRKQRMGNTFITKMLLTGDVRIVTGVSGSAYSSWSWQSPSFYERRLVVSAEQPTAVAAVRRARKIAEPHRLTPTRNDYS